MVQAVPATYGYGVKLVRGPYVRLPPHAEHVDDETAMLAWARKLRAGGARLAVDLFSGAGGLGLGLEQAGWRVVMGVDHDVEAVETHAHHFGGLSVDWDLSDPEVVERVAALVAAAGVDLIAGGPPCQPFSRAGRSLIRHQVSEGLRDAVDPRRELWRSYLQIILKARPAAVIMENVPDMALDREMLILRTMVEALEEAGYAVEERVVEAWRYGVPQHRQRLILVALRDAVAFTWPQESPERVSVTTAIGDLPEVEGGWRPQGGAQGWSPYDGPVTTFQKSMRQDVPAAQAEQVQDHITRPVREDDRRAFESMTSATRYSDLPKELRRYRDDIFDDKYKRLDGDGLSRTITAHIARDGYWYIHPDQPRTLTVREAARLQTFPDHFRFAGPPSAAFRQIGNAVPPRLGHRLGQALLAAMEAACAAGPDSREVSATLGAWWRRRVAAGAALPWLAGASRWQVYCAETLLERSTRAAARDLWPVIRALQPPEAPGGDDALEVLVDMATAKRMEAVVEMSDYLAEHPGALEDDLDASPVPGLGAAMRDVVLLAAPTGEAGEAEVPVLVTRGVLRVAQRFSGDPVDRRNKLTAGRLAIARMIGGGPGARDAHLALIELAADVCRPERPQCWTCPLAAHCARHGVDAGGDPPLF